MLAFKVKALSAVSAFGKNCSFSCHLHKIEINWNGHIGFLIDSSYTDCFNRVSSSVVPSIQFSEGDNFFNKLGLTSTKHLNNSKKTYPSLLGLLRFRRLLLLSEEAVFIALAELVEARHLETAATF